jgi:hypothetical protein
VGAAVKHAVDILGWVGVASFVALAVIYAIAGIVLLGGIR